MALNWHSVRAEHVARVCELVLAGERAPRCQAKRIVRLFRGQHLPAKHIAHLAYALANSLPLDAPVRFSSGEGTVQRLRSLGFQVERISNSSEERGNPA